MRQMFVLAVTGSFVGVTAASRPNILFMMADQLRYDVNGYTTPHNAAAMTQNLDRIAAEGLQIKYSFSSTPTCTPARAAILTGQSPWNHGMLGYGTVADRYPFEMPRALASAGYVTASFGKDHFGWNASAGHGIDHGYHVTQLYDGLGSWSPKAPAGSHEWAGEFDDYDAWFSQVMPGKDPQATLDPLDGDGWNGWHGKAYVYPEHYHPTAWVGRAAVSFIQARAAAAADARRRGADAQPFMAKVSFHRPHSPYDPPARLLARFTAAELPPIYTSGAESPWDRRFRGLAGDPPGCGPSSADAWCGLMPTNESDLSRRAYYASVAFVDEQVGNIYAALANASLLESTYIIWSADHGDGQGDHYHWRKGYPYEFSAHVPMLVRWPEAAAAAVTIARGTTISNLVTELRDVLATALDIAGAGAAAPAGHFKPEDGKSMLCLLQDPTGATCDYSPNPGPWREFLDLEHSTCYNESNHWNALTDGRVKYIFRAFFADEQLFNLTADPHELVELSGDPAYARTLALWRGRMVAQFESEGRGDGWVKDGVLQRRTQGQTTSPNYPHQPPPQPPAPVHPARAGDMVDLQPTVGSIDCSFPQCFRAVGKALELIAAPKSPPLCLEPDVSASTLTVQPCQPGCAAQQFDHAGTDQGYAVVKNAASGQCVSSAGAGRVQMRPCAASPTQKFIFGASGRLCLGGQAVPHGSGGCLTVAVPSANEDARRGGAAP